MVRDPQQRPIFDRGERCLDEHCFAVFRAGDTDPLPDDLAPTAARDVRRYVAAVVTVGDVASLGLVAFADQQRIQRELVGGDPVVSSESRQFQRIGD